ncbi:cell division protein ZapA [Konateibacter massiliensis]|uniref:cell division protein ZapA n=1 Tax=Konateibacter massiliensis TaxID=2002841 RepID=UPI000C146B28|nr:cell division protein ZapA [Konateibacter massiliensis]
MAMKNSIDVIIGGKVLTLSGYESEAYLQQIGSYINHKISEVTQTPGFNHLNYDTQNMYIQLNIADDYFKAKTQADSLAQELELREKEIYDFKHDLINEKLKSEEAEKKKEALQKEINELQKKLVKLQTKLREEPDETENESE